jgi:hypothetical protein
MDEKVALEIDDGVSIKMGANKFEVNIVFTDQ